jgi:hypothetical protein
MSVKAVLRTPFVLRARLRDRVAARKARYELAVVAIFREEGPFLDAWLAFHASVGVSHFFLYNNFSTDGFRDVLAPWIARGLVTLRDWPVRVGQLPAYRHCVRRHGGEATWMAFIDVDEFLFSPCAIDVRPILRAYGDLPGLLVYSPYFGSAGHRRRPAGPVVEAFTRRAPLTHISVKTIANPRWIHAIRDVHTFKYWRGAALDTRRRPLHAPGDPPLDVLRLNHYWSRSIEDLATKVRRDDASSPNPRHMGWHLAFEANLNAEEDRSIVQVARAVRAEAETCRPAR